MTAGIWLCSSRQCTRKDWAVLPCQSSAPRRPRGRRSLGPARPGHAVIPFIFLGSHQLRPSLTRLILLALDLNHVQPRLLRRWPAAVLPSARCVIDWPVVATTSALTVGMQGLLPVRAATTRNHHSRRTAHPHRKAMDSHTVASTSLSRHRRLSMCEYSCMTRNAPMLVLTETYARRQQQPQKSDEGGCLACLAGACLCCCAEGACPSCLSSSTRLTCGNPEICCDCLF